MMPPLTGKQKPGRVGIEIEFAGMTAPEAAEIIASARGVGGKAIARDAYVAHLEGGALDGSRIELDCRYANMPSEDDPDYFVEMLDAFEAREMAAEAASLITPIELSAPPLPESKLGVIDSAIEALRQAGGQGTKGTPFAAYGLHLNCELDPPDPDRAVRVASAYAFGEEWLRRRVAPDPMRRASPYVDPYPPMFAYALSKRIRAGELPLKTFIKLYGLWCPTRNHGLDMWPLLGWLDADSANRATVSKIKRPRPAFHYRLPNSALNEPNWSPRGDLELWRKVERIGGDSELLEKARTAWVDRIFLRIGVTEYCRRFDEIED